MKKFISMVMAAAMVVSLVPATAFAADFAATAKVTNLLELTKAEAKLVDKDEAGASVLNIYKESDVEIKINQADYANESSTTAKITVKLDGAEFDTTKWAVGTTVATGGSNGEALVEHKCDSNPAVTVTPSITKVDTVDKDEVEITLSGKLCEDDKIIINTGDIFLTGHNAGHEAKMAVKSSDLGLEKTELVFAAVVETGIEVDIDDVTDVAPEEYVKIEDVEIEPVAGENFGAVATGNQKLTLKLSKGFEFANKFEAGKTFTVSGTGYAGYVSEAGYTVIDDNEIEIKFTAAELVSAKDFVISNLLVEATTAKEGDVATLTVKFADTDSVKVEVAKVVESGLVMSVDEDEDVPVMWSGVDSANTHLTTDDNEHWSLEVTLEETFGNAYDDKDEFELTLPEGVFVTGIDFGTVKGVVGSADAKFKAAYIEGDHEGFVFEKRAFTETAAGATPIEINFELELVAVPGFVGDVNLGLIVDGEEKGEVLIAKFESPMVVEAEQNDLKIDYRNTEVPTDIVIKEAEAGLWAETLEVGFALDHGIDFEDDATFTVNEESEMEIDGDNKYMDVDASITETEMRDVLFFEIDEESDEEAAVVTISDISLYMSRNLAAGAYDLEMVWNNAIQSFAGERLYAPDCAGVSACTATCDKNNDCIVDDVADFSDVVKEAFVNIVTAGREQDDASFTTKVVVPVGESYIIAGEQTVALDVPAYVSAAGYTMLPVRAVATALGINNNNVLWDQTTKTVTILYGQRIITMTVGAKVINVNGSAIPASASVEVVNGRTFLPMRDLATALGVTDITWDAATKTATLNGNI